MKNKLAWGATVALAGLVAVVVAACGSSNSSSTGKAASPTSQSLTGGKRGGVLTVYDHEDFEHLDPGQAYFSLDYGVMYATQRPLYSYLPNNDQTAVPDLAAGQPQISSDGMTLTVNIRKGVHFSPPVTREITAQDVESAVDRGANPNVANPYFMAYFGDLVGADKADGGPFPGVTTDGKYTVVFHLSKPVAQLVAGALSLPLTAPVPEEFAKPLDAMKPTQYGAKYIVASGPYMLKADQTGMFLGIGYQPGKSATLVRNPNWNPKTDFRPAYLDQVDINIGGDPEVIGRQVLTGSHSVQNDTPAQSIVQLAATKYPSQITVSPDAGDHYVAVNNKQGPFSNVNVRRAFWAALDRDSMVKADGGSLIGDPATHFLYPGVQGFDLSGGLAGPQTDFNKSTAGGATVAEKYMKKAGYPSGKYTGNDTISVVGATGNPAAETSQIVNQTLQNLGFKTNFNLVDQSVMYGKYCGVPKAEVDVCPNVGWIRDFADPQTVLDPTFNGKNIVSTNNSNFGQVNDPQINAAMDAAETVVGEQPRAQAWAKVDEMLVDQAVAVPWIFDKQPVIESKDVAGVSQIWNEGTWDYSFTSLK